MIRLITSLVFFAFSKIAAAQIFIGFTQQKVRDNLEGSRIFRTDSYGDGTLCFTVEFKDVESVYIRRYFVDRKSGLCFLYIVEPMTEEAMRAFLRHCNKNYVIMSYHRWSTYEKEVEIDVKMHYDEAIMQHFFYFRPME